VNVTDLDRETVKFLESTSDPDALDRYRREEALGEPAYDVLPDWVATLQPRDRIGRCMECGALCADRAVGRGRIYCSGACKGLVNYRKNGKVWWHRTGRAAWQREYRRTQSPERREELLKRRRVLYKKKQMGKAA
jgi:hypothetical protein